MSGKQESEEGRPGTGSTQTQPHDGTRDGCWRGSDALSWEFLTSQPAIHVAAITVQQVPIRPNLSATSRRTVQAFLVLLIALAFLACRGVPVGRVCHLFPV